MLFMVMHKVTPQLEAGGKPDATLIKNMGQLVGEAASQGKLRNGAGLKRSAERVRLRFRGGECETTKGTHAQWQRFGVTANCGCYTGK